MRNAAVQLSLLLIAITSIHAVRMMRSSSLQGKVYPANGVGDIRAIRGKDSVNIMSTEGDFYMYLLPGRWKVVVDGRYPYKSIFFNNIEVRKGVTVDLGKISLQKEE